MFKNLIFDWSGTLVDDLALTLDASNYVFSQYGKPCMNRDEFRAEFQLPYPDYYARVLPHADLDELEDTLGVRFWEENGQAHTLWSAALYQEADTIREATDAALELYEIVTGGKEPC